MDQHKLRDFDSGRFVVQDNLEAEVYTFSEDVYCVNVYEHGQLLNAFCSDAEAVEEWKQNPKSLLSIIQRRKKDTV